MKIHAKQFSQHLQQQLLPIYLVSGDEPLLLQECCDAIRQVAKQRDFHERTIMQVNKSFSWHELENEARTLSLFAENTLLELHLESIAIGKEGSAAIASYAENPPAEKILLVICGKLDAAKQKLKWFKAIDKVGAIIQVWPVNSQEMPQWIKERLLQYELQMEPASIQLLSDRVEGNLLAAKQEIEKLRLLHGAGQLSYEQVSDALCDSSRHNVFQLVDAALLADHQRCLKILSSLRAESTEPVLVLWALSRELRLLCALAFANQQRQSLETVFNTHRVWNQRKPILQKALQRYSLTRWQSILTHVHYIDEIIKGARSGSVWHALTELCLRMSGLTLHKVKQ